MQITHFVSHDPEFGAFNLDFHRLPLVRLRERRRELVLALADKPGVLRRDLIQEIAEVQQAIKAIEVVIAE